MMRLGTVDGGGCRVRPGSRRGGPGGSLPVLLPLIALLAMIVRPTQAPGATLHVDSGLTADCPRAYDPSKRSCGAGSGVAYRTLSGAAAAAQPGDTVLLREGTYRERLAPGRSGAPGAAITFRNSPGEKAVLTGVDEPAIVLKNVSNIVVEGLDVEDVGGWGRIESSNNIVVRDNRFRRATIRGTTGGLKLVKSALNRIEGNVFEEGNDSLVLQESDRNLVQGNTFVTARHSLVSVRCGNFNVIRGNRFRNERQKACEIYDCEGTSDAPFKLDATKRNVFDGNEFAHTRGTDRPHKYNGIQYAGQDGIVRRNVFRDNEGGALNFQVYSKEALYNYGNHVYNNTFVGNRCYAIVAAARSVGSGYAGNIVRNNVLFGNLDCRGGDGQTAIGNTSAVKLENNAILSKSPGFRDEAAADFRLSAGSPMIDAAGFATRTTAAGSGTVLPVEDAAYFYDGFGIPGERGDVVQLEGQTGRARIVAIDYPKNTLTLDQPLRWEKRQGVHLGYSGSRPDLGAFEFSPDGSGDAPPRTGPAGDGSRR